MRRPRVRVPAIPTPRRPFRQSYFAHKRRKRCVRRVNGQRPRLLGPPRGVGPLCPRTCSSGCVGIKRFWRPNRVTRRLRYGEPTGDPKLPQQSASAAKTIMSGTATATWPSEPTNYALLSCPPPAGNCTLSSPLPAAPRHCTLVPPPNAAEFSRRPETQSMPLSPDEAAYDD